MYPASIMHYSGLNPPEQNDSTVDDLMLSYELMTSFLRDIDEAPQNIPQNEDETLPDTDTTEPPQYNDTTPPQFNDRTEPPRYNNTTEDSFHLPRQNVSA